MRSMKVSVGSIDPLELKALIEIIEVRDGVVHSTGVPIKVGVTDVMVLIEGLREVAAMLEAVRIVQGTNLGCHKLGSEIDSAAKAVAKEAVRSILVGPAREKPEEKKEA